MNTMNQSPFKCFTTLVTHPLFKPTFKTNMLHLVSNEGRVEHLLLLYKRLI